MGEAKRRQRILGDQYGKQKADIVWARSGHPQDLMETCLLKWGETGFNQVIWQTWEQVYELSPAQKPVCLYLNNFPQFRGDRIFAVSQDEFLRDWARNLCLPSDGITKLLRMYATNDQQWYLPPTVAAWADGKPKGDFVAQAIVVYGNRHQPFSRSLLQIL